MTRRAITAAVASFLTLTAASVAQQVAAEGTSTIEAQVRERLSLYVDATNRGDIDAIVAFYADDPRFHWVEDGALRYRSQEDVRVALEGLASFGSVDLRLRDIEVHALSDSLASVRCGHRTRVGDPGFEFSGVLTILMARIGEDWVFLQGHSSSARPSLEGR